MLRDGSKTNIHEARAEDMSNIRYDRHISLPQVGLEGQKKLNSSSVLCIGAGGLGSPVLMYLAAAGVGKIGIIDFDVVDLSNLQRQIIHSEDELGSKKIDSAKKRLLDLNSEIEIVTFDDMLTPENAISILENWDVIIDGTDNLPTRYLVDDATRILQKPWVYGSIYRFEGQVSVFNFNGGPCYRDLFPNPPEPNMVPSCSEGGVLGILPGVIGSLQATEAIKIILGIGNTLSGVLLLYNSLDMSFRKLKFSEQESVKKPASLDSTIDMFEKFCIISPNEDEESVNKHGAGGNENMFNRLSVQDFIDKKKSGWNPYFIDVRSDLEYASVKIKSIDIQVPHEDITSIMADIPNDRDIVIHCKSGMRSQMACMLLNNAGIDASRLHNLEGGIMAYSQLVPDDIE